MLFYGLFVILEAIQRFLWSLVTGWFWTVNLILCLGPEDVARFVQNVLRFVDTRGFLFFSVLSRKMMFFFIQEIMVHKRKPVVFTRQTSMLLNKKLLLWLLPEHDDGQMRLCLLVKQYYSFQNQKLNDVHAKVPIAQWQNSDSSWKRQELPNFKWTHDNK